MKKIVNFMLLFVMATLLASCGAKPVASPSPSPSASPTADPSAITLTPDEDGSLNPVIEFSNNPAIIVGLDENFPPMGFKDENGTLIGFDIDMATEAGKRMGVEMTFQPIDWGSKELELSSKKVDLLWNGFTITPQRQETILFTKPYLKNKQVIMVLDNSGIATKADLSGKIIGLQKESSALDAVNADAETKATLASIEEYQDNILAFQDLAIGRINAVVVDEIVAKYYLANNETNMILLSEDFGDEEYGVGMRMEDTELNAKLQAALDEMNADGKSAEISKKWFGEDIVIK